MIVNFTVELTNRKQVRRGLLREQLIEPLISPDIMSQLEVLTRREKDVAYCEIVKFDTFNICLGLKIYLSKTRTYVNKF